MCPRQVELRVQAELSRVLLDFTQPKVELSIPRRSEYSNSVFLKPISTRSSTRLGNYEIADTSGDLAHGCYASIFSIKTIVLHLCEGPVKGHKTKRKRNRERTEKGQVGGGIRLCAVLQPLPKLTINTSTKPQRNFLLINPKIL